MEYLRGLRGIFSASSKKNYGTPNKKKVVISPGFRKCASTSLQYMLRSNEQILSPYFHISCKDELTKDWREVLHEITVRGRLSAKNRLPAIAKKMALEVASRSDKRGFVISDENLVGFKHITKKGHTIFDVSAQVLPILEKAFRRFDVTFHFQTREMSSWIESAYAHEVWMRTETRSLEEFSEMHSYRLNWQDGCRKIAHSLSCPVNFVDISSDKFRCAVGKSLLEYFDVPQEVMNVLVIPDVKNPSPPLANLEKKLSANRAKLMELKKKNEHSSESVRSSD